jgi:hypothetical protein
MRLLFIFIVALGYQVSAHAYCGPVTYAREERSLLGESLKNYSSAVVTSSQLIAGKAIQVVGTYYVGQKLLLDQLEKLALYGTKASFRYLVVSDLAFHIARPPKAGLDAKRSELAVDGLVRNPELLLYLSDESACEYLHDYPDVAVAFDKYLLKLEEDKRILSQMNDEALYGSEQERQFWKEAIQDVGVQMIPFKLEDIGK